MCHRYVHACVCVWVFFSHCQCDYRRSRSYYKFIKAAPRCRQWANLGVKRQVAMAAEAAASAVGRDRLRKCPTVGQGRAGQARLGGRWLGVWGFRDWDASETDDILNTTHNHTYTRTHTAAYNHTWLHTKRGEMEGGGQAANVIGKPSAWAVVQFLTWVPKQTPNKGPTIAARRGYGRGWEGGTDHPVIWRTTCVRVYW